MSLEIIDGVGTSSHVTSDQVGLAQTGTVTPDAVILNVGEKLAYEIVSNNQVNIKDGTFMIQGKRGCIAPGTVEACEIANGTAGLYRNDLICIKYTKDAETKVEEYTIEVVQGTPGEQGTDPTVTTGDINDGALVHYAPLYRVVINGLNIESVTLLFSDVKGLKALEQLIGSLNTELAKIQKIALPPVGQILMTANNVNPGTYYAGTTWIAWGSGRVPVGVNSSDGDFNSAEKTGGAKSVSLAHSHTVNSHAHSTNGHALTVNEIPAHGHGFSGQTSTTGDHAHMYRDYYQMAQTSVGTDPGRQGVAANSDTDANPGAHTKGGGIHSHSYSGTTSNVGGNAAHSHGNTGASAPGTSSALGTQSVLQPYITCYMWKRTA